MKPKKNSTQSMPRGAVPSKELGSLLDSMAEALVLIDRQGNIAYFNDQAEKYTALARSLITGRPYQSVFEYNPWLVSLIARALETGQACTDRGATLHYGPDVAGRHGTLPVVATVTPWRDPQGSEQGALVTLSDRSRMASLENDLLRSDRLASLGTIAAGLAHEIKNPLGGIKGAAQLARRATSEEETKELLDVILKETERVNGILENLLRFGRPPQPPTEKVNLHVVLRDVVQLVSLSKEGKNKKFEEIYDPSLPRLLGASDALKQVFLNLIQNAAEASPEEGSVEIRTRFAPDIGFREGPAGPVRGFLEISIRDQGAGMDAETLGRLFTPFFTTKDKGTGLGLVMSHQIVKEHGGFITVESMPERGTTFVVHLPRGDAP